MKKEIIAISAIMLAASTGMAEEAAQAATTASSSIGGYGLFSAGIGMGLAALGGALGQGKIAASAMEGIGRNPQSVSVMQTPMILGLVFVETLVIFTFAVAFLLMGKV